MSFFDFIGDAASAAWDGMENAAGAVADAVDWVGDRADDVIGWFGDLFTGNLGTQVVPAPDLVRRVQDSKGATNWHEGVATATTLAGEHGAISDRIRDISGRLEHAWTGSAAQAAQARLRPLGEVTAAAERTFAANAANLSDIANGFDFMRGSLEPMPPVPPHKTFGDIISIQDTDTEKAIYDYNGTAQRNIERYNDYANHAKGNGGQLTNDYGWIDDYRGGDVTITRETTPPGPRPGPPPGPGPGRDRGFQLTPPPGPGPDPEDRGPGPKPGPSPVEPKERAVPPPESSTGHDERDKAPEPWSDQTDTAGYTPSDAGRSGTVPPPAASPATRTGGGGLPSVTYGGVGGPDAGLVAGGPGGARGGGLTAGPGSRVGAGLSGSETTGTARAGGAGASTGSANRGTPLAPGAGGAGAGNRGEDREHQRHYGVADDSLFAAAADDDSGVPIDPRTGLRVPPSTIGG